MCIRALAASAAFSSLVALASAQVVLVEPGHRLTRLMDSMAPLHPTQVIVEQTLPIGDIESICVDPNNGDVFFQLIVPAGSPVSTTTHVFRLSPSAGGLVTPVAVNTGFGINERGTDLQLDPWRGLLVTQDQNFLPRHRLASINPMTGAIGTWSVVTTPPIFGASTFGMDLSLGAGGSIAAPGALVFTSDAGASGIHECRYLGLASITHVPGTSLPGGGDDLVIQPDGDWIWVGDFTRPITKFLPFPPFAAFPSLLDVQTMFTNAGLGFIAGSRAAVCDVTGVIYVSFSGTTGGTGIFRIDEALTTATLLLTVGGPSFNQGVHDLEVGPSSTGLGNSLYFTVHDAVTGGEQIWEMSAGACCPVRAGSVVVPDVFARNVPNSIAAWPPGNLPKLGNLAFAVKLDDPANACGIPLGSPTALLLDFWTAAIPVPTAGCAVFGPGELMIAPPLIVASGPVAWGGPGLGAIHPLGIPFDAALCGLPAYVQGIFIPNPGPVPTNPVILTWRLDLMLGS